jgi:hypothetical protein
MIRGKSLETKNTIGCHLDGCMELIGAIIHDAIEDVARLDSTIESLRIERSRLLQQATRSMSDFKRIYKLSDDIDAYDHSKHFLLSGRNASKDFLKKTSGVAIELPGVQRRLAQRIDEVAHAN